MKRFISTNSDKYKNMSVDKKIKVIEAKLRHTKRARNVPYRYLTVNRLNQMLEDLYEEKNKQFNNINNEQNINMAVDDSEIISDNISFDADVMTDEYKKLSDENKMNVVRSKLTKLFENAGDKSIVVMYNGQKKKVNRDKQGEFKDLVEREKKLNDIIKKKYVEIEYTNKKNKISFYGKCKLFVGNIINNVGISLKKNKDDFNKKIKDKKRKRKYKGKYLKKRNNFVQNFFKGKTKYKNKDDEVFVNEKRSMRKRIAAGVCALVLVVTGFSLSKCNKSSNGNETSPTVSTSQDDHNFDNNTNNENNNDINDVDKENNNIENTEDKENNDNIEDTENKENNNTETDEENNNTEDTEFKLSFDDTVTIDKNSYIYTNSYDATYNTNSLNPYYGGYHERDVQGIVYELAGKIYVVYEYDVNAIEKQKQLENSGAVMTAVLVTRNNTSYTGEYEGYYNISSVRVKSR